MTMVELAVRSRYEINRVSTSIDRQGSCERENGTVQSFNRVCFYDSMGFAWGTIRGPQIYNNENSGRKEKRVSLIETG